jgi:exosortase
MDVTSEARVRTAPEYVHLFFFGFLILLCYAPVMKALAGDWFQDENMGHGIFVPFIAGYIVWQQRDELRTLAVKPSWWGLPVVLLGAIQSIVAALGVELFLSRTALIVTLAGAILMRGGTPLLKKLAFPLFLLLFMVPIPAVIFNSITFPLQLLASQLAAGALTILDIPVHRLGNVLELPAQRLSVVEACSGIRSLLSLSFLSLVYGYFFEKRRSIRIAIFLLTAPIAIITNGGRVTVTGVLSQIKPELAEGFFHESTGWIIFMAALGLLIGFHWLIVRGAAMVERHRA